MSHQGEDGWYPECEVCDGGNLGGQVVCHKCYLELLKEIGRLREGAFLTGSESREERC